MSKDFIKSVKFVNPFKSDNVWLITNGNRYKLSKSNFVSIPFKCIIRVREKRYYGLTMYTYEVDGVEKANPEALSFKKDGKTWNYIELWKDSSDVEFYIRSRYEEASDTMNDINIMYNNCEERYYRIMNTCPYDYAEMGDLYGGGATDGTQRYKELTQDVTARMEVYAHRNFAPALYALGLSIDRKTIVKMDYIVRAADLGNLNAMMTLVNYYSVKDPVKSGQILRIAAEKGCTEAIKRLGLADKADKWASIVETGDSVKICEYADYLYSLHDYEKMQSMYIKSYERGYNKALHQLLNNLVKMNKYSDCKSLILKYFNFNDSELIKLVVQYAKTIGLVPEELEDKCRDNPDNISILGKMCADIGNEVAKLKYYNKCVALNHVPTISIMSEYYRKIGDSANMLKMYELAYKHSDGDEKNEFKTKIKNYYWAVAHKEISEVFAKHKSILNKVDAKAFGDICLRDFDD